MIDPSVMPAALALAHDPGDAINWWRVTAPFARLRQHRIDAQVQQLVEHAEYRIRTDSIVLLPRLQPNTTDQARAYVSRVMASLRQASRALIYDVDDDLFSDDYIRHHLRTEWHDGKDYAQKRLECDGMLWAMSQADGITVATDAQADLVRSLVPGATVMVVENAIDVRWFRSRLAAPRLWGDGITIGWAGGRRPAGDFLALADAWQRVAARRADVRFVVVGDDSVTPLIANLPPAQVERVGFGDVQDSPMAYQIDIGCCSVEDEPFNRRKTPIKCWEYALAGAAVVATPALYAQDVADGFTGRLAETADDWTDALMALIEDADARRHLSANLAARVEQRHSLDRELWHWPAAWQRIVESRKAAA
ncbi:MAG: glycosyltransferase family 4 protein [Chloroflexota bacterium]